MTIDIKQMKSRLEVKRAELQTTISNLTEAHPTPVDPIEANDGQDLEDTALDFLEIQKEQSVLVTEQALLTLVNEALERIQQGTYGRCTNCGQPIAEKRLEALPWAERCITCEEQLEQKNLSVTELYKADLS